MNERLEEFKDYIDYLDDSQDMQDHGRFIDTLQNLYSDDWLHWIVRYAKEQAERVEELELECAGWKEAVRFEDEKLEQQNKRYREVFKQIKLQILFDGVIEDHRKNIIEIIDEALESESE